MKLIVGLGNLGKKYERNRHNVGFMFVDYLLNEYKTKSAHTASFKGYENGFILDPYSLSHVCKISLSYINDLLPTTSNLPAGRQGQQPTGDVIILTKPQTYMNKSGEAVKKLVKKYLSNNQRLTTNDLIVVHDDLDIPLGKFRIVRGYGPKQHNGIESIENHLHTKDFLRIRIGVDARQTLGYKIPGIEYILQNFTRKELLIITNTFTNVTQFLSTEKILLPSLL